MPDSNKLIDWLIRPPAKSEVDAEAFEVCQSYSCHWLKVFGSTKLMATNFNRWSSPSYITASFGAVLHQNQQSRKFWAFLVKFDNFLATSHECRLVKTLREYLVRVSIISSPTASVAWGESPAAHSFVFLSHKKTHSRTQSRWNTSFACDQFLLYPHCRKISKFGFSTVVFISSVLCAASMCQYLSWPQSKCGEPATCWLCARQHRRSSCHTLCEPVKPERQLYIQVSSIEWHYFNGTRYLCGNCV